MSTIICIISMVCVPTGIINAVDAVISTVHIATAIDGGLVAVIDSVGVATAVDGNLVAIVVATTIDGNLVAIVASVCIATAINGKLLVAIDNSVCVATTVNGNLVAVVASICVAKAINGKLVTVDASERIGTKVNASIITKKRSLRRPCNDNLKAHGSFIHLLQHDWLFASKTHLWCAIVHRTQFSGIDNDNDEKTNCAGEY
jgi:hypothetical protein